MTSEAAPTAILPDSSGLNEDIPCPKCEYNLRGLTVPRCPECGFGFAWADLPRLREEKVNSHDRRMITAIALIWTGFLLFILLTGGTSVFPLLTLALFVGGAFLISAAQAGIEVGVTLPLIGAPGWHRFRAWWEGVLIGYGLCALALLLAGYAFIPFEPGIRWSVRAGLWPIWLLTVAESGIVQCWVMHRRMHYWGEPIPPKRLLAACILAKVMIAPAWVCCPFKLMQI